MTSPLTELALLAEKPDEEIDLCRSALTLSQLFQPDLDPAVGLAQLDLFTAAARARVPEDGALLAQVAALNELLFDELGFSGNHDDFYDPRNSFIDQVLERRVGIPISLSVIYCEIAVRLGLPAYGVSFPAHFLVGIGRGDQVLMLDVFAGGLALPEEELDRRLADVYGDGALTIRSYPPVLRPAQNKEILVRMLRNLIGIYRGRGDGVRLLTALDAVLAVAPDAPDELRQRGLLYRDLGHVPAALADLRRFVALSEDLEQIAAVSRIIDTLAQQPSRLH